MLSIHRKMDGLRHGYHCQDNGLSLFAKLLSLSSSMVHHYLPASLLCQLLLTYYSPLLSLMCLESSRKGIFKRVSLKESILERVCVCNREKNIFDRSFKRLASKEYSSSNAFEREYFRKKIYLNKIS